LNDDRAPQIVLDYTPDEMLALVGQQAKIAFQAELDFFEWRADNEPTPFKSFMEKYLEWVDCSEPYADSFTRSPPSSWARFCSYRASMSLVRVSMRCRS
jgi:hypothetical protein